MRGTKTIARANPEAAVGALGLQISTLYGRGDERDLAAALLRSDGVALVAWGDKAIRHIIDGLQAQNAASTPLRPDDRIDMVYVLTAPDWQLVQVPQMLLAGDRETQFV